MKKINIKDKKWIYILVVVIVILIVVLYLVLNHTKKNTVNNNPSTNPQLNPNYKGFYDDTSGLLKTNYLNGKRTKKIDNCKFYDLRVSSSPRNSSFDATFESNNDKIVGTVKITFKLYDSKKNLIKEFYNILLNVKKGEKRIILAEFYEEIKNVNSVEIKIDKLDDNDLKENF